jgi:hypothetical protein
VKADPAKPFTKRRITIGAAALALAGLAPLLTGAVGIHDLLKQGHFVAKNGAIVAGPIAWIASSLLILAGLGMVAFALRQYRRMMSDL